MTKTNNVANPSGLNLTAASNAMSTKKTASSSAEVSSSMGEARRGDIRENAQLFLNAKTDTYGLEESQAGVLKELQEFAQGLKQSFAAGDQNVRAWGGASGLFHSTAGLQGSVMLNSGAGMLFLMMAIFQIGMAGLFQEKKPGNPLHKMMSGFCDFVKDFALEQSWNHFEFTYNEATDKTIEFIKGKEHTISNNTHSLASAIINMQSSGSLTKLDPADEISDQKWVDQNMAQIGLSGIGVQPATRT